RGKRYGICPMEPLAQPVRERLPGFGNIDIGQASKQANEGRAAESCTLCGFHNTTRVKKSATLHAYGGWAAVSRISGRGKARHCGMAGTLFALFCRPRKKAAL